MKIHNFETLKLDENIFAMHRFGEWYYCKCKSNAFKLRTGKYTKTNNIDIVCDDCGHIHSIDKDT